MIPKAAEISAAASHTQIGSGEMVLIALSVIAIVVTAVIALPKRLPRPKGPAMPSAAE
jgi:hypothetical protein